MLTKDFWPQLIFHWKPLGVSLPPFIHTSTIPPVTLFLVSPAGPNMHTQKVYGVFSEHKQQILWKQSITYIDRLSAGVFHPDPGLLNHVEIGPCHHQRGVATEEKVTQSMNRHAHHHIFMSLSYLNYFK